MTDNNKDLQTLPPPQSPQPPVLLPIPKEEPQEQHEQQQQQQSAEPLGFLKKEPGSVTEQPPESTQAQPVSNEPTLKEPKTKSQAKAQKKQSQKKPSQPKPKKVKAVKQEVAAASENVNVQDGTPSTDAKPDQDGDGDDANPKDGKKKIKALTNNQRIGVFYHLKGKYKDNKLAYGAIKEAAELFDVDTTTISRLWHIMRANMVDGQFPEDTVVAPKRHLSGRRPVNTGETLQKKLDEIPPDQKFGSGNMLARYLDMKKTTFHRLLQKHQISIKHLIDESIPTQGPHKKRRPNVPKAEPEPTNTTIITNTAIITTTLEV